MEGSGHFLALHHPRESSQAPSVGRKVTQTFLWDKSSLRSQNLGLTQLAASGLSTIECGEKVPR